MSQSPSLFLRRSLTNGFHLPSLFPFLVDWTVPACVDFDRIKACVTNGVASIRTIASGFGFQVYRPYQVDLRVKPGRGGFRILKDSAELQPLRSALTKVTNLMERLELPEHISRTLVYDVKTRKARGVICDLLSAYQDGGSCVGIELAVLVGQISLAVGRAPPTTSVFLGMVDASGFVYGGIVGAPLTTDMVRGLRMSRDRVDRLYTGRLLPDHNKERDERKWYRQPDRTCHRLLDQLREVGKERNGVMYRFPSLEIYEVSHVSDLLVYSHEIFTEPIGDIQGDAPVPSGNVLSSALGAIKTGFCKFQETLKTGR